MYFVWTQRMFQSLELIDTSPVEVIHPGLRNLDAGPDFFNAKVKIGDCIWAGNVEMHVRASDWYRHHHQKDKAYDSVILHVVLQADAAVSLSSGEQIRTVVMRIPPDILDKFRRLTAHTGMQILMPGAALPVHTSIACAPRLPLVPAIHLHDWIQALAIERMTQKMQRVRDLVEDRHDSWQEAFYVILARSLGTGINSDACERLARSLPYHALLKHIDSPIQIEAMLMGQAGFLSENPADTPENAYFHQLRREYNFLRQKFGLTPLPVHIWKMARIRPEASPRRRLHSLGMLLTQRPDLLNEILVASDIRSLMNHLKVLGLGQQTQRSIIINAVVPFLLAYGQWNGDEERVERALSLLEQLPAEDNRYMNQWLACGVPLRSALDTQALLHLYKTYCEPHKCMRCRLGCWLLKH